jgi:hypothetical protein
MKRNKRKELDKMKLSEERRKKRENHEIDASGDWKQLQNEEPVHQTFGRFNYLLGIYANKKNRRGSDSRTAGVGGCNQGQNYA